MPSKMSVLRGYRIGSSLCGADTEAWDDPYLPSRRNFSPILPSDAVLAVAHIYFIAPIYHTPSFTIQEKSSMRRYLFALTVESVEEANGIPRSPSS